MNKIRILLLVCILLIGSIQMQVCAFEKEVYDFEGKNIRLVIN